MKGYRKAEPKDIVQDATVYILGDDEELHEKIIDFVIRPDSPWKAFCADDGCRYGLDGCYIKAQ